MLAVYGLVSERAARRALMFWCKACRDAGLHEVQLAAELAQPPPADRQLPYDATAADAAPAHAVAADVVRKGGTDATHLVSLSLRKMHNLLSLLDSGVA